MSVEYSEYDDLPRKVKEKLSDLSPREKESIIRIDTETLMPYIRFMGYNLKLELSKDNDS